jgi:glycosyltransferase involved in cell wall biosynthesis
MRLLVCVPWYAPARGFGGGIVTSLMATVEGALEAGHEVTVATTDLLDPQSRIPRDTPTELAGAEVLRFPNISHRLAASHAPLPRGLRPWLRKHAREFDVVLVQDVYSSLSVLGARAAVRAGVPYVLQAYGTLPTSRERGRAAVKRAFLALWARRTVREAAACLSLSEAERREYLAQGADSARLHPIPPSLDISSSDDIPRSSEPSVVYLGRLHPIKRIDVLLDAFARVRAELPEARLDVIGGPTAHGEELRAGAGEGVSFRGLIPEEEKSRALASARVFALLSASEGLPVAPLEALACGTPVVLSPGCGLPEVDGVAGIVCDGSAAGAAEALLTLLRDPARAEALGAAGRTFASAYRREKVVPKLVELLERVANSSSSPA